MFKKKVDVMGIFLTLIPSVDCQPAFTRSTMSPLGSLVTHKKVVSQFKVKIPKRKKDTKIHNVLKKMVIIHTLISTKVFWQSLK